MPSLHALRYDNSFSRLPSEFFASVRMSPLANARLAAFNPQVAQLLELDDSRDLVAACNGQLAINGWSPIAAVYAGHQFGHYVPRLGDGRAMLLAEVHNSAGEHWDLQLKGGGPTPFSRRGDGRAVLRSSVREYLASIALTGLGIASSQALCLIASDEPVYREQAETGALLVRVANSHLRFGSFEYFAHSGQHQQLRQLFDYLLEHHFAQFKHHAEPVIAVLTEIIRTTANLIAHWQAYGFTHGVLNTDNMAILGFTLDYGPYAFMEAYQPRFIPNHSDEQGRYAFDQQPSIGLWNLAALAEALLPLTQLSLVRPLLDQYSPQISQEYARLMRRRLGLTTEQTSDQSLVADLLQLLAEHRADYNLFFRYLSDWHPSSDLASLIHDSAALNSWLNRYQQRLQQEPESQSASRQQRMRQVNPKYLLRTHLAQQVIQAAEAGNYQPLAEFAQILAQPFDEWPEYQQYAQPNPEHDLPILSCSS